MDFFKDLLQYFKRHKKVWLIPLVFILLFFSLMILLSGHAVVAPFIYTIF